MSELIIKSTHITDIKPHSNADALELAIVNGWQVCCKKGEHFVGQEVIFIPPDSMIPWELAEQWGVATYLSGYDKKGTHNYHYENAGRVKAIRLRGEPSLGFIIPNDQNFDKDVDLKDILGIYKYEEPEKPLGGQNGTQIKNSPYWQKYTDIENERNYDNVLIDKEPVIATEKLHGENFCGGLVLNTDCENNREFIISSHKHQRKIGEGGSFELPIQKYKLIEMIEAIYTNYFENDVEDFKSILIYGEIIGRQDLKYNCKSGELDFYCFDISINGRYISYDEMVAWCEKFGVPTVPLVYRGEYNKEKIWALAENNTLIPTEKPQISEGVVVKPEIERTHPKVGRVALKFVSNNYWTRKGGTEFH